METFAESDLKDMWDSELDLTKSSTNLDESYVHHWMEDDKFKDCRVILNDKLMSDALLNGTMPIKSEHSYSLSSAGNHDEASSNIISRPIKELEHFGTKEASTDLDSASKNVLSSFEINQNSVEMLRTNPQKNSFNHLANLVKTYNLHALEVEEDGFTDDNSNVLPEAKIQQQKRQLMMHRLYANTETRDFMLDHEWSVSTTSEDNEESISSEFSSDVEIEKISVKTETLSPNNIYAVSPETHLDGMRSDESHKQILTSSLKTTEKKNICWEARKLHISEATNINGSLEMRCVRSKDKNFSTSQTKVPCKTAHTRSESDVHNLLTETFRSKTANVIQRKKHESEDENISTLIIAAKNEVSRSINNNVTPVALPSKLSPGSNNNSIRQPISTPLISSQPKGSTGVLLLTEEEKRTLIAEGYPVPKQLPLSKTEEKSLKKIRRKIKNKISAQESRRKKKEYMDQLERRVDVLVKENNEYKKRIEVLENANNNLLDELRRQETIIAKEN